MTKNCFIITLFAFCLPAFSQAKDIDYFAAPLALRFEGVGEIYGVAGGINGLLGNGSQFVLGVSTGEVEAAGIILTKIPLIGENFTMSLLGLSLSKANLLTEYSRGFIESDAYLQELSGRAYGANFALSMFSKRMTVSTGVLLSEIQLNDYFIDGEKIIRPETDGYHDIKTTSLTLGLKFDFTSEVETQKKGVSLGVNAATASGRAGQSDTLTTIAYLASYLPLTSSFSLTSYLQFSDSQITKEQKSYTDSASVKSALNTSCSNLTDLNEREKCQGLEDNIADYIVASNKNGTAAPLGGSNGLRSFNELSVRAAHTRLFSLEARWDVSPSSFKNKNINLALAPFVDIGYANDDASEIYKQSKTSYGLAIRVTYKKIPVRLTSAWGENEQYAWFLTAGQAW